MKSNINIYLESLKKEILPNNKRSDFLIRIIEKRLLDPAKENINKHHIFPKSWGGPNNKDNFVKLTESEHCKAHQLLYEVTIDKDKKNSMQAAYWLMSNCGEYKIKNHKEYGKFQEECKVLHTERAKEWHSNMSKQEKINHRNKISISRKGKPTWNSGKKTGPNIKLSLKRKGHSNFRILITGEIKYLHKDDPRVKSGLAVGINKGKLSPKKGIKNKTKI